MHTHRSIVFTVLIFLALLLAACGGGEAPTATPAPPTPAPPTATPVPPTATPVPPTPEPTATPSLVVSDLTGVKAAVVQIEAQGTFRDPEVGTLYNAAGRGSGFIIDPSGIAVTNNHVVTGAALLRVWVGGEGAPRNARILGVSECADLAVIDIDGQGYPYLDWYEGSIDVGLDVYAAGFPLGDPEYTLTRGIIAKARANGESSWASVDGVVQHDASINPGNSGGPLITADGRVVAVNYAGDPSASQYFAIAREQALPVIERLQERQNYLSIGVNGRAINTGEGLSGIWVASVKSGSPADTAGVKAGDIITQLEGLVLSTDGTMSDYCDILRTHEAEETLNLEVLRFDTEEVLAGQLNGRPLALSFSFAREVAEDAGAAPSSGEAASYTYVTIADDSGYLKMDAPSQWRQVDGSAWQRDGEAIGLSLTAAPNIDDFQQTWGTPGVFFGVTDQIDLTVAEVLDNFDYNEDCTYDQRRPYEDAVYTGSYDFWYDCGSSEAMMLVLAARPADQGYLAVVMVQMLTDADLEAADEILASFIMSE